MRSRDWSSDVCSSDLELIVEINLLLEHENAACFTLNDLSKKYKSFKLCGVTDEQGFSLTPLKLKYLFFSKEESNLVKIYFDELTFVARSEEHTSELQSLIRISYADFCLKKKIHNTH